VGLETLSETLPAAIGTALVGETAMHYLGAHPADLAFLAMAHHQLGHAHDAQATLTRLRETMKNPIWASNQEAQTFLREAAALIDPVGAGR
jgi:hypothetical protein